MSVATEDRKLARRDPTLDGLRVVVVGLGKSGLAAARLAAARGAHVTVVDDKPESELATAAAELRRFGAELRAGGIPHELADSCDLVVTSPGVPPGIELLRRARERDCPIWGEIELAARYCRGTVVGVTGSNGKSTVTTMIAAMLACAGRDVAVGGNLDVPFAALLRTDPGSIYALELSSFQLETLESLRPAVAVVLNLSPDHLDRYASFDDYARAKARLLELQQADDAALLNADDPESERFVGSVRGRLFRFSTRRALDDGAFLRGDRLVLRISGSEEALIERDELSLVGEHNVANALAAALAARLVSCPVAAIVDALRGYRALPHRLEHVRTIDAVRFFNDSKATNPASTLRALEAFERGRVQLILGGRDKNADWDELIAMIPGRVKRVLLVGEAATMLHGRLAGRVELVDCATIERAVAAARETAVAGDVVLLAPGCASFDQYSNYEARGDAFRRIVETHDA